MGNTLLWAACQSAVIRSAQLKVVFDNKEDENENHKQIKKDIQWRKENALKNGEVYIDAKPKLESESESANDGDSDSVGDSVLDSKQLNDFIENENKDPDVIFPIIQILLSSGANANQR